MLPFKRIVKYSSTMHLLLLLVVAVIVSLAGFSCKNSPVTLDEYYHSQIQYRARPYAFDYVKWEINALRSNESDTLPHINPPVSKKEILGNIVATLNREKINVFPAVNFYIGKSPMLLVVSPRDKIEYFDRVVLSPDLVLSEIDRIEDSIEELGLSALVTDLGGFSGVYPPIISETSDLKFIIDAGIEEWLHQYMVLRPLGFRYLLDSVGIPQDRDVVTMNETMVGIVSKEIGGDVYAKYYKKDAAVAGRNVNTQFNYNAEMRKTRAQLDKFLAKGDIQGGENYLEIQRLIFVSNGYKIRKLNQAYFAFHGIYAYDPAAVSPIYRDMQELRDKSASIAEFLKNVSAMNGYTDLLKALNKLY